MERGLLKFFHASVANPRTRRYPNVFSLGDASSLPNSKTAAAITSQAPVLVHNLLSVMSGKQLNAEYDGYASCPLLTGHNELMLCEFKYGGVPKETFSGLVGGQEKPRRAFYHLKKDFFVSFHQVGPLFCNAKLTSLSKAKHLLE